MKDFDVARRARAQADRTFRIAGRDFKYRAHIRPEVFFPYDEMTAESGPKEAMPIIDQIVVDILEPEYADAWRAARAETGDDALSMGDLTALVQWLMSQVMAAPLAGAATSSPGSPTTRGTTDSTGTSSPPAAVDYPT